jgi:hypothetical protein
MQGECQLSQTVELEPFSNSEAFPNVKPRKESDTGKALPPSPFQPPICALIAHFLPRQTGGRSGAYSLPAGASARLGAAHAQGTAAHCPQVCVQ